MTLDATLDDEGRSNVEKRREFMTLLDLTPW
jgi:hypothetical protein